jgi:tetratricopeptide (TPR) repeat protein
MEQKPTRAETLRRATLTALVTTCVLLISYVLSRDLHHLAIGHVATAEKLIDHEEWDAALDSLQWAIWEDPFLVEAYLLRARAVNGQIMSPGARRRYSSEDALADLVWVIELLPDSGEAHYQRGLTLSLMAKVEPAREAFAKAIPLLDDPTSALLNRAHLSFFARDYDSAVREISAVISRHPREAEYYETRGLYRRFLGDPQGAVDDERKSARLSEGDRPAEKVDDPATNLPPK